MTFLNEITERHPEAISFAPGRPYEGFFDTEDVFTHLRLYFSHLAGQGSSPEQVRTAVYQYGPTAGLVRELIADSLLKEEGIRVPAESIVITVGCQEAMLLVLRALFSGPGDVLLVSSPCYVGITGAARLLDINVTAVAERESGVSCPDLENAICAARSRECRPRALYLVPDHANPSGNTMPLEARHALLDLAERMNVLILEDSPYRLVSPGGQLPTLKSLDRHRRVVYLGSFAKTAFPGARVGFVAADQQVYDASGRTSLLADEIARIKSMVTVNTPTLSQAAIAGILLAANGRLSEHNANETAHYKIALATMLGQLDYRFPVGRRREIGINWTKPTGGFFLTVRVPFRANNDALERSAQSFGVTWTPMSYFYPQAGGEHEMRLSFSCLEPAEIEEGIRRLASFIESELAGGRAGASARVEIP